MIQSTLIRSINSVKYLTILKLIILQQNISTVWIFSNQNSLQQQETSVVIQHLVGTLPKYVLNSNNFTKKLCVENEEIINLNIFLGPQTFGVQELDRICPTDYTMVLVENITTKEMVFPENHSNMNLNRIVFGIINGSTITSIKDLNGYWHNKSIEDLFAPTSLNLHSSDFRIFFQLRPPNSCFTYIDNKYLFFGPDAQTAQEISKVFNATAVFQTDIGIEYPQFQVWFNDTKSYRSRKIIKHRTNILTTNVISNFYQNSSNYADIYISAQTMKGNTMENTEFLYPHDMECLRIVVPRIKTEQRFTVKLIHNSIVQSICLTTLLMFIYKIIFNNSYRVQDWIFTFFSLLASLFGQKRQKISNKLWESIWNYQLLLLVVFSTAGLSAISYQTLVSVKYVNQIDTLNDLIASNLMIFVERSKATDFKTWGKNLDPKLSKKFVYQNEMINFMRNGTNDVAFVWEESMASLHVTISEYNSPVGELPEMRMVMEPLYCGFSSPRMTGGSPYKYAVGKIIMRLFESGIRSQQLEWTVQFVNEVNRKNMCKITESEQRQRIRALTLSRNYGMFVLYGGGVTVGSCVFILEILWKWLISRKKTFWRRRYVKMKIRWIK